MAESTEWFDRLYRENAARLYKQACRMMKDSALAEDLVEEAFTLLLSKQAQLKDHPNLPGWLALALRNLVYDEYKCARHQRELPMDEIWESTTEDIYQPPLEDSFPAGLLPKEREALLLRFEQDLSYEEMAQCLGISPLNCRVRVSRAKAHYKELTEKEKIIQML